MDKGLRSVSQLLQSSAGQELLIAEGIYTDLPTFKEQIRPPVKRGLPIPLDAAPTDLLIFGGQQVCADYGQSVISKFEAFKHLEQKHSTCSFFEWVDTDDASSDRLISRLAWPASTKKPVRLASQKQIKYTESRYVSLDNTNMEQAAARLSSHIQEIKPRLPSQQVKLDQLKELFNASAVSTLSEFNLKLSTFLLEQTLGFVPFGQMSSQLLASGMLTEPIENFINLLPGVIEVFNRTVIAFQEMDIDPRVKTIAEDFFPLYYSCDMDNRRIRLRKQQRKGDNFAVTVCSLCGTAYEFFLGRKTLTIAELTRTCRWSPNVFMPMFVNDLVSGMVVGKSSSIYMMVFNTVLREVLHAKPVALFLPTNFTPAIQEPDSLVFRYFQKEVFHGS